MDCLGVMVGLEEGPSQVQAPARPSNSFTEGVPSAAGNVDAEDTAAEDAGPPSPFERASSPRCSRWSGTRRARRPSDAAPRTVGVAEGKCARVLSPPSLRVTDAVR
jgi:hypothetical protein